QTNFRDSFVEDGTIDEPSIQTLSGTYSNFKSSTRRQQYTQRPTTTVLIKKKQFSSLANNYDLSLLDDEEKIFLRCVKQLFRRKYEEIAFHESLIDFNSIYSTTGFLKIDSLFGGALDSILNIISLIEGTSSFVADILGVGGNDSASDNISFLQELYQIKQLND